jgi:hypothetical protein
MSSLTAWIRERQPSGGQMCGSATGASMTRPPCRGRVLATASVPRSGAGLPGPRVRGGGLGPVSVWLATGGRSWARCAPRRCIGCTGCSPSSPPAGCAASCPPARPRPYSPGSAPAMMSGRIRLQLGYDHLADICALDARRKAIGAQIAARVTQRHHLDDRVPNRARDRRADPGRDR